MFYYYSANTFNKQTFVGYFTYNTYFNKFLLVGMRNDGPNGRPDGIYYSLSDDLINWLPDQLIMECETWWNNDPSDSKHHYPSIIDPDSSGRNFEYSDQNAYLYYTLWHDDDPTTTYNRDLVRIPITFSNISNYSPTRPNCMYPENQESNVDLSPTLESSSYDDPDNDLHNASQWQITAISGNYTIPLFDSGWNSTALVLINSQVNLTYSTTYYWRVRYQDANNSISPWSSEFSFNTRPPNEAPSQPVGESPPTGTTGVGNINVSFESSVYFDNNSDLHTASQWQISTISGNFSTTVFDSGTDTVDLEYIMVPTRLELNTTHYWRVRHQDAHSAWSQWSNEAYFTTELPSPPTAPNGLLAVTLSSSEIFLNWDDNAESDVNHYCIYRSQASGVVCNVSNFIVEVPVRLNSEFTNGVLTGEIFYF